MGKIASPDTPLDEWKTHFDVNFFSLVTALKATLPSLRKSELGGRVVFVSSGAAIGNIAGWGPYNASKAALIHWGNTLRVETLALECARVPFFGTNVNRHSRVKL